MDAAKKKIIIYSFNQKESKTIDKILTYMQQYSYINKILTYKQQYSYIGFFLYFHRVLKLPMLAGILVASGFPTIINNL